MLLCKTALAASLVTNGDFSANAAGFTTFPGYANSGSNPSTITGWTYSGAVQFGINGDGLTNPFGPGNRSAATYYAFIQRTGQLSQALALTADTTYDISFLAAARNNNNALGRVTVADNSTTFYDSGLNAWSNSAFESVSSQFTTGSTLDGPVLITLINDSPNADLTVDYADVIVEVAPIPEPSSLLLLGLGAFSTLLLRRR